MHTYCTNIPTELKCRRRSRRRKGRRGVGEKERKKKQADPFIINVNTGLMQFWFILKIES